MPNTSIVAYEISRQWTTGSKQSSATAVVRVCVDCGDVFDLLEAIHLLFGELMEKKETVIRTSRNFTKYYSITHHVALAGLQHHGPTGIDAALQVLARPNVVEHQHAETRAHGQDVVLETS